MLSTGRFFVYAVWKEHHVNKGASLLPVLSYLLKLTVESDKSLWSDVGEKLLAWLQSKQLIVWTHSTAWAIILVNFVLIHL